MKSLYPPSTPWQSARLPVSELHTLAYEQYGRPDGFPVIFLHGGPGAGCGPDSHRFFDPDFYRIITLDQRGSGKSTPYAEYKANTTWDLVSDLEVLRRTLNIDRWLVFGGSWGSTLALAYAINHPAAVAVIVLRGVYMGRKWENRWLFQEGASWFYPEKWQAFLSPIPRAERDDLALAYYQRLISPDPAVCQAAAQTWSDWEGALVHLDPQPDPSSATYNPLAIARLEAHYIVHNLFFPQEDYILAHASALRGIPLHIVQGRYDLVCPPQTAWELSQALPHATLNLVQLGVHSSTDLHMVDGLVSATDDLRSQLRPG